MSSPSVGIVGNDVPRQLVLAAGAVPRRLTGSWLGAIDPAAAQLLGAADAPAARILGELTAGAVRSDALIVCADSQAHVRLFYVLRAVAPQLPLHLLDLPRADSLAARRFGRVQLESLVAFLADVTGRPADVGALAAAAQAERQLGRAIDRLRDRRRSVPPRCDGTLALDAMLSAAQLPPSDAVARIEQAQADVPASATRVHVTGSNHPDAAFYRELEEHGYIVVSEDHDTGDGAWLGAAADGADVGEVLDALLDQHFTRVGGSPTASSAARAGLTRDTVVESAADLVVAAIRDLDEAPAWDVADQAALLAEMGVPFRVRTRVAPGGEIEAAHELARQPAGEVVSA
ncbi:2-hydroxyacyl-CoA dehydratase family protein [Microbacterium ureisolvens]|uniref:2-hydroxyacyl-CoA dehydratase family protein n=1 Tax=Microbacterium ureisolvens TaxID=2781186 RepID=UPI0036279AC9